jgi:hypothetical protein
MGRLQETFETGKLRGPFDRVVPQPIPQRFLELLKELEKCAESEAGVSSGDDRRQAASSAGGQESKPVNRPGTRIFERSRRTA